MPRLVDVWRAVDPEARIVSGDAAGLEALVRGVSRSRTAPPHLPPPAPGHLLLVDGALLGAVPADRFIAELEVSGHEPTAVLLSMTGSSRGVVWPAATYPILVSERALGELESVARAYLADEPGFLERHRAALRLAAAEAALADPTPGTVAGLGAHRVRRGVAVVADGDILALHPRPAGRALAARFAAAHSRLLGTGSPRAAASRRLRDGLWVHEQRIRAGASVWLFDDLPIARVDEAAAEALSVTLRALLRRPRPALESSPERRVGGAPRATAGSGPGEPLAATLVAVARFNGRIAPAARSLGVHRNTVLYRLRVARDQHGVDPRRPEDALRLLREADRPA